MTSNWNDTMPNVLAIDQSTSATKALIFDVRGGLLAKASKSHEQIYPRPGWVEHDADEIWNNTLSVIRDTVQQHPKLASDLQWLSITNQRETIVVFDRDTGRPLHNAIVWQCRRGDEYCRRLTAAGHDAAVVEATGLKIDTYFSASKLKWIMDHKPEIADRLRDGTALAGTMDAYLIYRLTGNRVFATDHTNACRTLLYNIHQLTWDEQLCHWFDVPRASLPEVRESNAEFGATDADGALPRELPICGVMGDSQASLFALGCHHVGDMKVTFGTGSSLLLNIGRDARTRDRGTVCTVAWVLGGEPTYCLEGIVNYSAATIEWLKNQLQLIHDADESALLAGSVEDNGGVYLIPAFAGLSAPYWNSDARAAVVGLSAHSTKAHVVRASLESIAYQIRDVLEMMKEETGIAPTRISADGGATRNEFLMQFTADIVDTELRTSPVAESSPLGAVRCGALGRGVYSALDELASLSSVSNVYLPNMDRDRAGAFYEGWKKAVKRVL